LRRLGARSEVVGQAALAAVLTIFVEGHEYTSTTGRSRALAAKTFDLAIRVDLVVLQDGHLDLLPLMLDFFRGVVGLLFALLASATKTKDKMEGRFLLDVVVTESATILELLSCENQSLLVGWDALLVLDLIFDIVDCVG